MQSVQYFTFISSMYFWFVFFFVLWIYFCRMNTCARAEKPYRLAHVKHKLRNQRSVRDVIHLRLNNNDGMQCAHINWPRIHWIISFSLVFLRLFLLLLAFFIRPGSSSSSMQFGIDWAMCVCVCAQWIGISVNQIWLNIRLMICMASICICIDRISCWTTISYLLNVINIRHSSLRTLINWLTNMRIAFIAMNTQRSIYVMAMWFV